MNRESQVREDSQRPEKANSEERSALTLKKMLLYHLKDTFERAQPLPVSACRELWLILDICNVTA